MLLLLFEKLFLFYFQSHCLHSELSKKIRNSPLFNIFQQIQNLSFIGTSILPLDDVPSNAVHCLLAVLASRVYLFFRIMEADSFISGTEEYYQHSGSKCYSRHSILSHASIHSNHFKGQISMKSRLDIANMYKKTLENFNTLEIERLAQTCSPWLSKYILSKSITKLCMDFNVGLSLPALKIFLFIPTKEESCPLLKLSNVLLSTMGNISVKSASLVDSTVESDCYSSFKADNLLLSFDKPIIMFFAIGILQNTSSSFLSQPHTDELAKDSQLMPSFGSVQELDGLDSFEKESTQVATSVKEFLLILVDTFDLITVKNIPTDVPSIASIPKQDINSQETSNFSDTLPLLLDNEPNKYSEGVQYSSKKEGSLDNYAEDIMDSVPVKVSVHFELKAFCARMSVNSLVATLDFKNMIACNIDNLYSSSCKGNSNIYVGIFSWPLFVQPLVTLCIKFLLFVSHLSALN